MKTMLLPKLSTKKPVFTSVSNDISYTNHLNQNFTQHAPNLVWVSDITYLKAGGKFYYLCVIIDLFSRKVIAYKLSSSINSKLVIDTLYYAFAHRKIVNSLIFHSDRGSQYTSSSVKLVMDNLNIVHSFSKKGHPYDNAVAECFFKYLKQEEINRQNYQSFEQLQLSVFEYIEGYYNSRRPHTTLGLLTPNQKESTYADGVPHQHRRNTI